MSDTPRHGVNLIQTDAKLDPGGTTAIRFLYACGDRCEFRSFLPAAVASPAGTEGMSFRARFLMWSKTSAQLSAQFERLPNCFGLIR